MTDGPNPQSLDEAFEHVCDKLIQLFISKHRDYGKGNVLDMGELGIAFRTSEKIARLRYLLKENKDPENESLEDSWKDIAVYSIIAILLKRGEFEQLDLSDTAIE